MFPSVGRIWTWKHFWSKSTIRFIKNKHLDYTSGCFQHFRHLKMGLASVFLWPHSVTYGCLTSIVFCVVNLLTCVSLGTQSWTASKHLRFHLLPISPLSPINQCDATAWISFPTAQALKSGGSGVERKCFHSAQLNFSAHFHNCSAPRLWLVFSGWAFPELCKLSHSCYRLFTSG